MEVMREEAMLQRRREEEQNLIRREEDNILFSSEDEMNRSRWTKIYSIDNIFKAAMYNIVKIHHPA